MALASKIRDNEMVVIDDLSFAAPKTKDMATVLKALGLAGGSTLIATAALIAKVEAADAKNITAACFVWTYKGVHDSAFQELVPGAPNAALLGTYNYRFSDMGL